MDSNKIRNIFLDSWKNRGQITIIMLGDKIIAGGCNNECCLINWGPNNVCLPMFFGYNSLDSLTLTIDVIVENISKIYNIPKDELTQFYL